MLLIDSTMPLQRFRIHVKGVVEPGTAVPSSSGFYCVFASKPRKLFVEKCLIFPIFAFLYLSLKAHLGMQSLCFVFGWEEEGASEKRLVYIFANFTLSIQYRRVCNTTVHTVRHHAPSRFSVQKHGLKNYCSKMQLSPRDSNQRLRLFSNIDWLQSHFLQGGASSLASEFRIYLSLLSLENFKISGWCARSDDEEEKLFGK